MNLLYINIGKNIQDYLNRKQISKRDFAERCHVTPQALHQIMQDRKGLNATEILQIAEALHLDINELVEDVNQREKPIDAMSSIRAKVENEHTKERLHFLEHVMEMMLKIEGVTGRNPDEQTR